MAKKSKKNLYNFDFGTVRTEDSEVKITISKEQFTHDREDEIKYLPSDDDPLFLPKRRIIENEDDYTFVYDKQNSHLKILTEIKKEEYPVKVSIAEVILEQDILAKYEIDDIYVSLNPATLFYYPMNEVKYTYSGNQFMPRTKNTSLEQYKACVVSILTNIPYEKCLATPDDVAKNGNELIKEIYNKSSRQDLLKLIKDSKNVIDYGYIQNRENEQIKWKRRLLLTASVLGLATLGGIIGTQMINSKNQLEMAQAYEQQIENQNATMQAHEEMEQGNYDKAIELYEQAGEEKATVATMLFNEGQYQKAIDLDESNLEKVIQEAYETDNEQSILDLNSDNLSEEYKLKLENEQAIVQGDTNAMANVLNFLTDENTAERLAQAFIEQNELTNAQRVLEQYPENQAIMEIVQRGELQNQITDLEEQLNNTDEEEEEKREQIQTQLDEKKGQIESLGSD